MGFQRHVVSAVTAAMLSTGAFLPVGGQALADRVRDQQWHLSFLDVAGAHRLSQGEGITVAVIDTGISAQHPDLAGNVLPGLDVVPGGAGNGWGDIDGHGTGMCGLIAAHGHGSGNGDGALGLAPKAKILPIRVATTEAGSGDSIAMANAVDATATDKGAVGRDAEYGFGVVNPVRALSTTPAAPARRPAWSQPG